MRLPINPIPTPRISATGTSVRNTSFTGRKLHHITQKLRIFPQYIPLLYCKAHKAVRAEAPIRSARSELLPPQTVPGQNKSVAPISFMIRDLLFPNRNTDRYGIADQE